MHFSQWQQGGRCTKYMDDKNHTGMNDCCVSSWFCSHPVGSYPWDQEWTTDPYQDRLLLHLTLAHDIIHQAHPITSPMTALTFNETKPHHPSRTTSSSRAIRDSK